MAREPEPKRYRIVTEPTSTGTVTRCVPIDDALEDESVTRGRGDDPPPPQEMDGSQAAA